MTICYVAIHCEMGREALTYERILAFPRVQEASIVMGLYDILCKLEAPSTRDLEKAVLQLRKIPHVKTTMTLLVL